MNFRSTSIIPFILFSVFSRLYPQGIASGISRESGSVARPAVSATPPEAGVAPAFPPGTAEPGSNPGATGMNPQPGFFERNETVQVLDLYLPMMSVSFESYQERSRFGIEAGLYKEVVGPGMDEYDYYYITRKQGGKRQFFVWSKVEGFGRYAGFSIGVFFFSKFGEAGKVMVPLTGFRLGDMRRFYFSVDAYLIMPVMYSIHGFIRYPYAQCWIGYLPGFTEQGNPQVLGGIEIPILHRVLIKAQGAIAVRGQNDGSSAPDAGFARIGIGFILNRIK
jgi:hypothetical protein